jgi:hypothetical protein
MVPSRRDANYGRLLPVTPRGPSPLSGGATRDQPLDSPRGGLRYGTAFFGPTLATEGAIENAIEDTTAFL